MLVLVHSPHYNYRITSLTLTLPTLHYRPDDVCTCACLAAWLLPGCCLYPSLPSPRTLLGLTWGDATLRVLIRISWLTVKTLSLHSTTSRAWVSLLIMRDFQPPRLPRLPPEMWIRVLRRLEIQDLCNVALVGPFILYFSQWGLERSVGKYN